MEQYIKKSEIVAEIERKKAYAQTLSDNAINSSMQQFYDGMKEDCNNLLNFLDALEVKEVDLEEEVANWWDEHYADIKKGYKFGKYNGHYMQNSTIISLAKHFFELGIKAQKGE